MNFTLIESQLFKVACHLFSNYSASCDKPRLKANNCNFRNSHSNGSWKRKVQYISVDLFLASITND